MKANKDIKTLAEFKDEHYGKVGSPKRDKLDKEFEVFKLGVLIQEARLEKGLTQEQLAQKCGTNKAYISKVENNRPLRQLNYPPTSVISRHEKSYFT